MPLSWFHINAGLQGLEDGFSLTLLIVHSLFGPICLYDFLGTLIWDLGAYLCPHHSWIVQKTILQSVHIHRWKLGYNLW